MAKSATSTSVSPDKGLVSQTLTKASAGLMALSGKVLNALSDTAGKTWDNFWTNDGALTSWFGHGISEAANMLLHGAPAPIYSRSVGPTVAQEAGEMGTVAALPQPEANQVESIVSPSAESPLPIQPAAEATSPAGYGQSILQQIETPMASPEQQQEVELEP